MSDPRKAALEEWAADLESNARQAEHVAESFAAGGAEAAVRRDYLRDARRNRTLAKRLREIAALPASSRSPSSGGLE